MSLSSLDSRHLFLAIVLLVAVLRLLELRVARRNSARLLARGAVEHGASHYPVMVALHTAFLCAAPAEVWLLGRPFRPLLAIVMGALVLAAMGLRLWVIRSLQGRWTTRVIVLPEAAPVSGGPFRRLRHPNYVAVVVEIFALPLIHGAWLTSVVFSALNALLLAVRIRVEEAALAHASPLYGERLMRRPRLLPVTRGR